MTQKTQNPLRLIDIPPTWLVAFLAIAWWQAHYHSYGLSFGGEWASFLGGLMVGGGILLMLMAALELRRHRTTIVPRQEPSSFVQSGIYRRSRNPIYLADVLILTGLILYWDAVLSLPLVPLFIWIIEKRFIEGEEKMLRRKFRAQYAAYSRKVRRWL